MLCWGWSSFFERFGSKILLEWRLASRLTGSGRCFLLDLGSEFDSQVVYRIVVRGALDADWEDYLEGLTVTVEGPNTILFGLVRDPPALYGIVNRLRDLGLELISVERISPDPSSFSQT